MMHASIYSLYMYVFYASLLCSFPHIYITDIYIPYTSCDECCVYEHKLLNTFRAKLALSATRPVKFCDHSHLGSIWGCSDEAA